MLQVNNWQSLDCRSTKHLKLRCNNGGNQNRPAASMFIGPSDGSGSVLVPIQLKGSENYGLWQRSMYIALQAKRKLGFVLGTCKRSSFEKEL
ncbi:hypothetical protein KY285_036271 [Solanum tuberosum]|nr:hypothetical protein KY285_036271 [Solanum tuberosum]